MSLPSRLQIMLQSSLKDWHLSTAAIGLYLPRKRCQDTNSNCMWRWCQVI